MKKKRKLKRSLPNRLLAVNRLVCVCVCMYFFSSSLSCLVTCDMWRWQGILKEVMKGLQLKSSPKVWNTFWCGVFCWWQLSVQPFFFFFLTWAHYCLWPAWWWLFCFKHVCDHKDRGASECWNKCMTPLILSTETSTKQCMKPTTLSDT